MLAPGESTMSRSASTALGAEARFLGGAPAASAAVDVELMVASGEGEYLGPAAASKLAPGLNCLPRPTWR